MTGVATSAVIAASAIAFTALLLLVVAARRREARVPRDQLAQAVDEMRLRMDSLASDLSDALARSERETRRSRLFGELGGSIDLEELIDRILDAAMEIAAFDAALVSVEGQSGSPTVMTRGMTVHEAANPPTSGAGNPAGTVTVSYRYGPEGGSADVIRGGVFIPLIGRELHPIGTLSLFWRRTDYEPAPEHVEAAENLAESCVPALENARRYGEARKMAETDALTGLYNQRFFHDTLRREVTRAQRYERNLAIVVFDLDNFKTINDELGHLAGDRVLTQAADRLREAVRSVDVACRIGGDEFAVILPESSAQDAEQLYRRVHNSLRGTSLGPEGQRLRLSAGIAELQHGDSAGSLFERADGALYRAKGQGKDRADIAHDVEG